MIAGLLLAGLVSPISAPAVTADAPTKTVQDDLGSSSRAQIRRLHPLRRRVRSRTTLAGNRHHRRAPRFRSSSWRVSSFGDPGLGDNLAGEDPVIRQAALEAIGNLNGSVVVVDPNTGRILSIVNQKLALTGAFTPCSTLKPMAALAGLSEGIISSETRLPAEGRCRIFFRAPRITVQQALAESDNDFFFRLGEMLGYSRVARYFHDEFGLGERAGLDIAGESPGVFPSAPPRDGGVGRLTYFGQDIQMTPLQLAAFASALANGGTLYYLQYPRTPGDLADFQPVVRRRLDDVASYIPQVRQGMAGTVQFGTGRLAFNPDEQLFGKTGTCSENGAHLGWFASFSEGAQPDHVVVVLLRGGPPMFGPHAAEIAGRVYRGLLANAKLGTQARSLEPASSRAEQ
jgi:penicillin-binding protein 2